MKKYRIKQYSYKAWEIDEYKKIESGKNKGEWQWVAIRYPGNMQQAFEGMIDILVDGDSGGFTADNAQILLDRVENAVTTLLDAVVGNSEVVMEVGNE